MKKIILTSALFLMTFALLAQVKPVQEVTDNMSEGKMPGFKVMIPEVTKKDALKAWEKLMKDYDAKTEKVKKQDDYRSLNANIPSVSDRPIVVYALFDEKPEGVFMYTYFDLGGAYLTSELHGEKATTAQNLIHKFATDAAKASIEEKVREETKKLEKLEKDQKGLEKDKEGYEKDIKDAKETIEKREKDIVSNTKAQEDKVKEIAEQKEVADKIIEKLKGF